MANIFTDVNMRKPRSNTFNLSHDVKLSGNMGELIPVLNMECVPGDVIDISSAQMIRFAPLRSPVMHHCNVYMHYFFVPNRILWPNWEDFITGGEDGTATPTFPFYDRVLTDLAVGELADYLGIPVGGAATRSLKFSALPFVAYGKIYNEYYRDQNLSPKVQDSCTDGIQTGSSHNALVTGRCAPRAWQHDYFTSCLPFTQKGAEATIPLGTSAPLEYEVGTSTTKLTKAKDYTGSDFPVTDAIRANAPGALGSLFSQVSAPGTGLNIDVSDNHIVDLSSATAAGIIDLRRAFKLQEWLEKNARGGSRYTESILSHFGVKSSDARLQRPEFLGGSTSSVKFSEVLQHSDSTSENTPLATQAGHGISVGGGKRIKYFAEEHGILMCIMSIMPKTAYFQGLHRQWVKFDKFDYYWPSFAHIGEQAVLNEEIFITDVEADDQETFGYIPRFAEYKYMPSRVCGEMRTTLDFWHLARKFSNAPALNNSFVSSDPDTRIFAVEAPGTENLYCHVFHDIKASRRMPYFGNPKM